MQKQILVFWRYEIYENFWFVNNWNIFKDNEGLLRVGGKISKSQNINFDLAYPILKSKNHSLFNLIKNIII